MNNMKICPKVLIVEDDKLIAKAMSIQFKSANFKVKIAKNGDEALDILNKWVPSAVIRDILMPEKDGFEVLTEIKKTEKLKGMPVLIASNLNQEKDVLKGIKLSAAEFFVKSNMDLQEIVRKTLYYIKMSDHGRKSLEV